MDSKLNSIEISSILVLALIAAEIPTIIENVFAQEGAITPEGSVNDTMSGGNATQWVNATLAFAQNDTMSMDNSTMMNATLAFAQVDDTGMTQGGNMGNMNQSQGNETGGLIQGQSNEAKDDGNNEEEEEEEGEDE
ncbi:MAG: hypothetical protein ACXWEW_07460 [Nitrososphaeraceae archaeon]